MSSTVLDPIIHQNKELIDGFRPVMLDARKLFYDNPTNSSGADHDVFSKLVRTRRVI